MAKRKRKAPDEEGAEVGPRQKRAAFAELPSAASSGQPPPFPDGFERDAPKGDALNTLARLDFNGTVHVVTARTESKVRWEALENATVLGFDVETRPVFLKGAPPNPPALLQLCSEDECWLFQLLQPAGVSSATLQRLRRLLEAPAIVKAGVGVIDDYKALARFHFPAMRGAGGVLDLQEIVRPYSLRSTALRSLTAIFLCRRLDKSEQLSDWQRADLSQAQLWYAAADAWAGLRLHKVLRSVFDGSEAWAPPRELTIADA